MIINGDSKIELKKLEENSVDQLVTDPPYGYSFMGKDWDKAIVSVDIWKEVLRVLKPGAFGFIMSAPRQDVLSRMIVNISDAGFDVDFTSIYWTYATGFPKAHNISKGIDKKLGKEREVVGVNERLAKYLPKEKGKGLENIHTKTWEEARKITAPNSDQAKQMEGSYGGFQPKPAVEVIIVVQKPPTESTQVGQALDNGKGITWLGDCRIPYADDDTPSAGCRTQDYFKDDGEHKPWAANSGRFPANLLISDDVLDDGKEYKGGTWNNYSKGPVFYDGDKSAYKTLKQAKDTGGYSRFFSLDAWAEKNLPFLITPKTSKKEKNAGCKNLIIMEIKLCVENMELDTLQKKVMLESMEKWGTELFGNNTMEKSHMDMRYTTKMKTNKIILYLILNSKHPLNTKDYILSVIRTKKGNGGNHVENVENTKELKQIITSELMVYLRGVNPVVLETQLKINISEACSHPTVKPIKLMSYLITMGSREGEVVLDPFAGSGSTGVAAVNLNRKYIMIEMDDIYFEILKARITHAEDQLGFLKKLKGRED